LGFSAFLFSKGALMPTPKNNVDDALVSFGDAVKADLMDDGSIKLGGYLIRFSDEDAPDITGDFFADDTDYGNSAKSLSWFNHRMPVKYEGDAVEYTDALPEASLARDETGIFAEIILKARNEYEKQIAKLGLAGKLAWSSGTAPHLVERKKVGKAWKITRWPLGLDASLTPTPAEPRNTVMPIKSLLSDDKAENTEPPEMAKESEMEKEELKGLLDVFKEEIMSATATAASDAADEAVKKYSEDHEEVKAGFVTDVKDEADRQLEGNPFKAGEFFKAVAQAELSPYNIDKRLLPLKATGLNEAIPSQGGFLVPTDIAAGIFQRMYPVGSLISLIGPRNVSGNGLTINAVDETSRADGSRYGGVQGYWLNEAGTKTASKPTFRQIELKLKKVAALVYATDELLEDATALESWITTYVPEELRFKVEDAFMNGDGVGKPLGVLNSTALVSATRTDASNIDANDVARMWARRWVGVSDYVWLCNPDIQPELQVMTIGQIPVYQPPGMLADMPYGRLLGRPVIETEYNPTLGTLGDLLLFSPSQYVAIQKGGVQSASSIHVNFTSDESVFRFVYRVDGEPLWADALTPFQGSNTVSPYVALAATT